MRSVVPFPATRPAPPPGPDPAFAARPRLARLGDALRAAVVPRPRTADAPVFFFDPARQAELLAARPPAPPPDPHPVAALIAAELSALFASAEVRRVARAVPGLRAAAVALASVVPAAKDLADLLAVPDDEAVVVLDPAARTGWRLVVSGVADVGQFHRLLIDAAGLPPTAAEPYQFFRPAALRSDGTLPTGFDGCRHWLWGHEPLAAVPLVDGERVIVAGEPAYRRAWEDEPRFPDMPAAVELDRVLSPFQVADRLAGLIGQPVPVRPAAPARKRARAA
ncbi:MAG: hypothetical protein K2X82_26075 [Gemmataceae bacterium]|nr:hypothetical protein [Gemmataceae bacterium]